MGEPSQRRRASLKAIDPITLGDAHAPHGQVGLSAGDLDAVPHSSTGSPPPRRADEQHDNLSSPRAARIVARALYDPAADGTAVLTLFDMFMMSLRQGGAASIIGARGPSCVVHALLEHAASADVVGAAISLLAELASDATVPAAESIVAALVGALIDPFLKPRTRVAGLRSPRSPRGVASDGCGASGVQVRLRALCWTIQNLGWRCAPTFYSCFVAQRE